MIKGSIKKCNGHPIISFSPLETKGRDGQVGLKKDSIKHPVLSISPLGINGNDGQA